MSSLKTNIIAIIKYHYRIVLITINKLFLVVHAYYWDQRSYNVSHTVVHTYFLVSSCITCAPVFVSACVSGRRHGHAFSSKYNLLRQRHIPNGICIYVWYLYQTLFGGDTYTTHIGTRWMQSLFFAGALCNVCHLFIVQKFFAAWLLVHVTLFSHKKVHMETGNLTLRVFFQRLSPIRSYTRLRTNTHFHFPCNHTYFYIDAPGDRYETSDIGKSLITLGIRFVELNESKGQACAHVMGTLFCVNPKQKKCVCTKCVHGCVSRDLFNSLPLTLSPSRERLTLQIPKEFEQCKVHQQSKPVWKTKFIAKSGKCGYGASVCVSECALCEV